MYCKMRSNVRTLRKAHPPATPAQRFLLNQYRIAIQEFGEQLLKPPAKINADHMNDLGDRAVDAFIYYLAASRADDGGE
jgi:hypothetical protein